MDINEAIEEATREVKRMDTEYKQGITDANARMDRLETAFKRGNGLPVGAEPATAEQTEYKTAFAAFLRYGEAAGLKALQQKSMLVGSDPDGGFLAPNDLSNRIITKLVELSPLRTLASVVNTSAGAVEHLLDTDEAEARWVDEMEERRPTGTPRLGKKSIVVHELTASPLMTERMLEDATFDPEAWLARKLSQQFALKEGRAFINGSGKGQPRGFLTYPDGTSGEAIRRIASGAADGVTGDALLETAYSIKSGYRNGACWLMPRSAQLAVRKLKASDGTYLWQPSLVAGQPAQLAGYPVYEDENLPAFAPGSLSIAFGNFKEAYEIVDRTGISVKRDDYTRKPWVEFYTRKRVGGDVINFEALALISTGA